jgi:clan AA aspartic protease (TIGR02281 family)
VTCALFPKAATAAQYGMAECASIVHAMKEAQDVKKQIALARQNLTFCQPFMQGDLYSFFLGDLARVLNQDDQHQEAMGVANRCLEINRNDLPCLFQKATALFYLGRASEAKPIVEMSLSLGAITDLDVIVKRKLQQLHQLLIREAASGDVVSSSLPNQISSRPEVPLKKYGGTFLVPVQINGAITLDFTVDTGASDVSVPADVFSTLRRTGTIKDEDIIGEETYLLANGSKEKAMTFTIRSLKVGDKLVENVRGSVASAQGTLLLGQSFLGRFKSWSFDNSTHQLVLQPQ